MSIINKENKIIPIQFQCTAYAIYKMPSTDSWKHRANIEEAERSANWGSPVLGREPNIQNFISRI